MKNKILLVGCLMATPWISHALQDDLTADPTTIENDDITSTFRKRQFINLTVGIEHDEQLPKLPEDYEFRGDFRRIVSASVSKELNILRFVPKSEGFATLTIHEKKTGKTVAEYKIDIGKNNLNKVVREVRALLGDIEGISIKIVNNRVVVDGQILLPKDMSRIYSVVKQFGDQATSIVSLSPVSQKRIAEVISREINNPEIEVRSVNGKIVLSGNAGSEDEKKAAEDMAMIYLPEQVVDPAAEAGVIRVPKAGNFGIVNLIKVKSTPSPQKKMVQLVVHYVELSKDYSKNFKFQWTPQLGDDSKLSFSAGGSSSGGIVSQITGVVSNLLPKLNFAKTHGHARVLESTTMIVKDGEKGEIRQETDEPYTVTSAQGQGTQFQKVGIVSSITPNILEGKSSSIDLKMDFAISSLAGRTDNGTPIVSRNSMQSSIIVRDRQSAAVGGLIRSSSNTGYNRTPSGVTDPIITLYNSKQFGKQQTQFVVFVTPVIKVSASAGSEQIKKKFRLRD